MSERNNIRIICPRCRNKLGIAKKLEKCCRCGFKARDLQGVLILREDPNESKIDQTKECNASNLEVRNSSEEKIPFIIEALSSGGLVLELGAGIERCKNPNLIKTDGFIYDYALDYIVDAHNLPFDENTFDYVYSLAVFEHLHSPWIAAKEIFRVLKPGGKVYTLVAFQQHLHGFPHHYFNVTMSGAFRLFRDFVDITVNPSPVSSMSQIAYILMDFYQMVENLENCPLDHRPVKFKSSKNIRRISRLKKSLHDAVKGIADYGDALAWIPENRSTWETIAPALDIIATKPEQ